MANRAAGLLRLQRHGRRSRRLLDAGAERVAYIDIDVHHGDGTQWIFYEEPRVLTCSVHETGRYLFPGTGGMAERGIGAAVGTSINVPLPPYAGDRPYLRAIEEVIAPAVLDFAPDVIVTQDGADPHHADPLAHLQVTMPAFPARLPRSARDRPRGRRRALGGPGRGRLHLRGRPAGVDAPLRRDARRGARRRHPGVLARGVRGAGRRPPAAPPVGRPRARGAPRRSGRAPTWRATASSTRPAPSSSH